jgi:hypothetical protein
MTRDQILQQHASARVFQARFDSAFEPWGEFRRDLAVQVKKLLPEDHKLRAVQYRSLRNDAYETLVTSCCSRIWHRNDSIPYDAPLRQVTEIDGNGIKMVKFLGQRHFIEDFKSPVRKVFCFNTPQGAMTPGGQWMR